MNTKIPAQYSEFGQKAKKVLHTKVGAFLGYAFGISGFNRIDVVITRAATGRRERIVSFNSRTNKGAALTASLLAGTSLGSISSPLPPIYMALSTSVLTPAAGDTALTGETAVSGLARAAGTPGTYSAPGSLDGAASYVLTKAFTAGVTGPTTINSAALFDAASSGNLFVEGNLSSAATLGLNDIITVNWSINL